MEQELYSVEEVAERLGLHVRTVRHYVREGRLKAVRIGKQYRIAAKDLEALAGIQPVQRNRYVEVSSIVEIDAISPEVANRITNSLIAVANTHGRDDQPLRVETIYNEERAHLKVILTGSVATTIGLLQFLTAVLENQK